ncbi:hypothetical protein R6Q59_022423 [Mikania micrantha]
MHFAITTSPTSSAVFIASRFSPSLLSKPSLTGASLPFRSISTLPAFRSASRWSHGVDWRSSRTLRAQIGAVAPVVQQFQRKIASMGHIPHSPRPGGAVSKVLHLPALNDPSIGSLLFQVNLEDLAVVFNTDAFLYPIVFVTISHTTMSEWIGSSWLGIRRIEAEATMPLDSPGA